MKYLAVFLLMIFAGNAYSQTCDPNMDFEYGNFSNWHFFQGTCCVPFTVSTSVTPPSAATTGRETITSGTGTDPYGGFPVVAPVGNYSLKLGTDDNNRKADRARYYVHVPSGVNNYALLYRYAIVMEDPGHAAAKQPRFQVNTVDSATGDTVHCGNFLYVAGSLPGFSLSSVGTDVYYKPWATASINLSGYGGHTIIVDFTRGDCDLNAHFGYGYVDMTCGLFAISVSACQYNSNTTLSGPPGFESYTWMDSSFSTVIDTGRVISITTPSVSTVYKLIIGPYAGYGCPDTLTTRVIVSNLALHPHDTAVCIGKTLSLNAGITGGRAPISYSWTPSTGLSCTTCLSPAITPATTRKYYITVTDSFGCFRKDSLRLSVNGLPAINAGTDKTICINNTTSITVTGGSTYLWSPTTGLSCSTCSSPTAAPANTTNYIVTGTDTNGCINTDTVKVKVNPLPTVNAGTDKTICFANSTTLAVTGTSFSYSWSPTTGLSCSTCANPTASPTSTTTYIVTGTDTNSCIKTDTVVVKVNPLPNVSAGADKIICRGSSTILSATGAQNYSWNPTTGLSCSTCANPTASPINTTTYIVTGTDTSSCVKTDTVLVIVNPLPVVNAGADKTICFGSSATLVVTGASSYSWSPTTGLSCGTCANPTASPSTTTTYIATGTDTNNCIKPDTVVVRVNALPNVNAGPDKVICLYDSASIAVTGASSYSWSPTIGLSCNTCAITKASPGATTTYVVTGTDTNGCVKTDTVVVKVNSLPIVSASPDKTICRGDSTTLTASGAANYSWSPSTGLSCANCSSPTTSPANTTTYVVTGTDTNTCIKTDTVVVVVSSVPNVNAGADKTVCIGHSTTLVATGASTYSWSPTTSLSCSSCSNPVALPTSTTTYVVMGTDTNGCAKTDTVVVYVNALPNINAGPDKVICLHDSASITITGVSSYSWSPATGLSCSGCATTKASPGTTTTYVVTGTDTNGCVKTDTVVVKVNSLPSVNAGSDKAICRGDSTTLTASGAATYAWNPSTGLSCANCSSPTAGPINTTSYIVTGTDTNTCVNTDTVKVVVNGIPNVSAGPDKTLCIGNSTTLAATGASTYSWTLSTGLSCASCSSPTASPTSTTTYTVTGTDANGCENTDTVIVNILQRPVVNVSPDTAICPGNWVQLTARGAKNYSWFPSTGLSCGICDSTLASPGTTTKYTIVGVALNGCSDTQHVTVTVHPAPNITVTRDTDICDGKTVQLRAIGAKDYVWQPPSTLSCPTCANPFATPLNSITYTVRGANIFGCLDSNKVIVNVIKKQPVSINGDDTICIGQSVQLLATGGTSYQWTSSQYLNNDQIANPLSTPLSSIQYKVMIKQGTCFTDSGFVNIMVAPILSVNLGNDTTIQVGSSVHLYANVIGAVSYYWTPAEGLSCIYCPDPIATPIKTTNYKVLVTGLAGCNATDDIAIHVICENGQIFIPNTFTPNGDGLNDKFYPSGKGAAITRMSVYDRWGELLYDVHHFQLNDPNYGWDGTYKGKSLAPDVYVYIITAVCETGESLQFKGDVSIIK